MNSFVKLCLCIALFIFYIQSNSAQTTYTWKGVTGDWQISTNWTPNGVPGSQDTAIVNSGRVTLTADVTIAKLELSTTLEGEYGLLVTKLMIWSNSNLPGSDTLTIATGATLRLSTTNQKSLYRTLINNGTTIWEAGTIYMASGTTILNNGSFLDQRNTNNNLGYSGNSSYFINDGEYIKSGTGWTNLRTRFTNNSSMDIQTGQVTYSHGGNNTGSINVEAGTLLKLSSSLTLGGQVSGAGIVEFWSNITVQGNYDITGNTFFASNTTIFDNSASIVNLNHGQELQIPGRVEFNTGEPISIDSILLTGHIGGSDSIAILKSLNWSNGSIQGSGTMNLTSGATLRLSTANQKSLYRNIVNNGTTIWEAGTIYMASGTTILNNGSFLDQRNTNNNLGYSGNSSYFINDGEYIKSGTGWTNLRTRFTNNSSMDIQTGQVTYSHGGNNTGSINVEAGTLLKLSSSLTLGGQVSGAGIVEFWSNITVQGNYDITGNTFFASNTTIFDNSASIVNLNHGQELQIPGRVEFNTGEPISIDSILLTGHIGGSDSIAILKSLNWSNGSIQGSGTMNLTSGATLRLSTANQKSLYRNIVNNGTTIWEAGTIYMATGASFFNYGSFLDQRNTNNNLGYGGNTSYFINDGEYIKSGTGLTNLVLGFSNMPGGEIQGTGTLLFSRGFSNEGTVSPGNSPGVLILRTDYPTTPTSKLNIEIGGTPTSENNDRLEISGEATLGGTLTISLIDNFVPAVGDTFEIVTYASYTGSFETINGLNTGTGVSFNLESGSTTIKLITIATPNSPPSEFSLLEPQDLVVLNRYDTIDFSWNASTDVDDDQLEYILNIFGTSADTTIGSINETAFEFISNEFLQSNTTYDWTVIVSDGTDTIASPDTISFTTPVASSIDENFDWNSRKYSLSQNFPNPFTSNTTILFNIPVRESITLKVYDHLGREVLILIDEEKPAGGYKIEFDASSLDNGLYFYRFQAGDYVVTKTMILLK